MSGQPRIAFDDEEFKRRVGELGRFMQDAAKAMAEAWTPIIKQQMATLRQAVDALGKEQKP